METSSGGREMPALSPALSTYKLLQLQGSLSLSLLLLSLYKNKHLLCSSLCACLSTGDFQAGQARQARPRNQETRVSDMKPSLV